MHSIINNTYIIDDCNKSSLLLLGFRFNSNYSDNESECYTYHFPIFTNYIHSPTLECELMVELKTSKVKINVFDKNSSNGKTTYKPFYNYEYGNYSKIIDKINKVILSKFQKLGIHEKVENNK